MKAVCYLFCSFKFFSAERFSFEKRTLLLTLNFKNCCLSVGRFTRLFTAYSLIVVQKKNNKHTQSLKNVGRAFLFTAGESFAYPKKSVKLIGERFF